MSDLLLDNEIELDNKQSVDAFIGQKLRNIRLELGITLSEVAKNTNLSMQLIQKYETGSTRIPVSILCRIANILNVNPADFFEGYETLIQNPQKKHSLSHSKSNSLNILLISMSLELDYILQNLAEETDLKISTFNLANCDDIDDYARQLKHISHKIPVPDIVIYDMPAQKSNIQNFIKKIRLKPLNIEAPIIILSMLSDILIMKNAYYRGVAGYIYKNIPMSDLKDSLKYVLLYWGRGCNLLGTIS